MDIPLILLAIQREREAEIARLRLAAAVADERACNALDWSSAPRRSCAARATPGFSSLFGWVRQIRSSAS